MLGVVIGLTHKWCWRRDAKGRLQALLQAITEVVVHILLGSFFAFDQAFKKSLQDLAPQERCARCQYDNSFLCKLFQEVRLVTGGLLDQQVCQWLNQIHQNFSVVSERIRVQSLSIGVLILGEQDDHDSLEGRGFSGDGESLN